MLLPPWAVLAVFVVVLLLAVPAWLDNMRIKQIRGTVRRMVRAEPDQREKLGRDALWLASRRVKRVVALVEASIQYDQRALQSEALALLDGVSPQEARRLRSKLAPEAEKKVLHPLEVVVRVERLLAEGMVEAARDRLEEGLARHPDDPDLLAWVPRVQAASEEVGAPAESGGQL